MSMTNVCNVYIKRINDKSMLFVSFILRFTHVTPQKNIAFYLKSGAEVENKSFTKNEYIQYM